MSKRANSYYKHNGDRKQQKSDIYSESDTEKNENIIPDLKEIKKIFERECSAYTDQPYTPAIMPSVDVIVVFGDIHGDYEIAIDMFKSANLIQYNRIERDYDWIGNKTYVVQVGDQVDRCRPQIGGPPCKDSRATDNDEDSDVKILKLFNRLDKQARKNGGMVISLLGNHELLNATGYMNYVSYEGLKGFEDYVDPITKKSFSNGMEARIHAFKPGNEYGKLLACTRYPAVIIGSNVFVHAGIIDALITKLDISGPSDIENINVKMRLWLLGIIDKSHIDHIIDSRDLDSMFWTRFLGKIPPGTPLDSKVCQAHLSKALDIFRICDEDGDVKMMIGHTPQSFMYSDDINSTCGGKIWRVDNGSSKAFDSFDEPYAKSGKRVRSISRRAQYLKIINDNEYYICDANNCRTERI
jgi:hypothetical protein